MHRVGVYFDHGVRDTLKVRYDAKYLAENTKLINMIQEVIDQADIMTIQKSPFRSGEEFNEGSPKHVVYLLNSFLGCQVESGDKSTLTLLNLPITNQILKVRALGKLLNSFIDSLPDDVGRDGRIHSTFKSVGADTGRMSCLAEGTLISTKNGVKSIETIATNDVVKCIVNIGDKIPQIGEISVDNLIFQGVRPCIKLTVKDDTTGQISEIICTEDHLILDANNQWIPAGDYNIGDKLL